MLLLHPRSRAIVLAACGAFLVSSGAGCAFDPPDDGEADAPGIAGEAICLPPPFIDPARSLVVTDDVALAKFPFKDVLDQIIASAGVGAQTSLALYQQWWDLNNNKANKKTSGPHCDDHVDYLGQGEINGFPIDCPRQEGRLATTNPFSAGSDSYLPLGLFNRFDLAPADGAHCGEYRIVYGKLPGPSPLDPTLDRVLIIFEARMPNPDPSKGREGCRPIAEFWAALSQNSDAASRASLLQKFYFTNQLGAGPVIDWSHYAGPGSGQIRTNQFMFGRSYFSGLPLAQGWQLREHFLEKSCTPGCSLTMQLTTVKNNPFGAQFSSLSGPTGQAFRSDFVNYEIPLLVDIPFKPLTGLSLSTLAIFNAGQSDEQGVNNDYSVQLATNPAFQYEIQAKLTSLGSSLTPDHIAARAMSQSCAGCHQLSNGDDLGGGLTWPSSNTFTHISETRALSPALTGTFLPFRAALLSSFLTKCM